MNRIQISPEQFIVEANRMLRAEAGFRDGLLFLPFPEGAIHLGATGYQYDGDWHPAYQRAWDKTGRKFEISHEE